MNMVAEQIRATAEVVSLGPDMAILDEGRGASPVMPGEMFGDLWPLICDIAKAKGSAPDNAALAFLAAAASAIGGKRRVSPWGDWSEPSVLWAACVGDPSSNKSPAIDAMVDPLSDIEADFAKEHGDIRRKFEVERDVARAEYDNWQAAVKAAVKEGKETPAKPETADEPQEPARRRCVVKDTTVEALVGVLQGNRNGVLCHRDELTGWLESFDRYNSGGKPFWLEAFRGGQYTADRKGGGTTHVPFNGVSVLGSIQPDKFRDTVLQSSDDGMAARFLYAWPAEIDFARSRPVYGLERVGSIYRALIEMPWGMGREGEIAPRTIPFDDAGADLFEDWGKQNQRAARAAHGLYKGFVGKCRGLIPRLALVSEYLAWASRGGDEPQAISRETVGAAIDFVEDYAKPSALRVFGAAALPEVERNAAMLAKYVRSLGSSRVNLRELKRSPHKTHLAPMRSGTAMDDAAAYLVENGIFFSDGERSGDTSGRQSKDFTVCAQLLEDSDG
ncbi:YfjI family protein [uncultured Parasphingopyxis sp.]|uniref:YfjI family protein n=1 Tax=uncultured Parasphingopyxis sp. TaxID=1547918 RepID=UPI0026105DFF|nr:YfjI family protein [uncultured Parasphingopyxis sp.]